MRIENVFSNLCECVSNTNPGINASKQEVNLSAVFGHPIVHPMKLTIDTMLKNSNY